MYLQPRLRRNKTFPDLGRYLVDKDTAFLNSRESQGNYNNSDLYLRAVSERREGVAFPRHKKDISICLIKLY